MATSLPINVNSSGDNIVVPAVVGKSVRVMAMKLIPAGAVNVQVCSGTGTSKVLDGLEALTTSEVYSREFNPMGWYQTVLGDGLNINLSGGIQIGGVVVYVYVENF